MARAGKTFPVFKNLVSQDAVGFMFVVSLLGSTVVLLTALSFPQYFIFVPFTNGVNLLSFFGAGTLLGWGLLVVGPPLVLRTSIQGWNFSKTLTLVVFVSIYPFFTTAVKVYGLVVLGQLWAEYLVAFPIMIFVEWVLPISYLFLARSLSLQNRLSGEKTKSDSTTKSYSDSTTS